MVGRARWLDKTPFRPPHITDADWEWACETLADLLPQRSLTHMEAALAHTDVCVLASAKAVSDDEAAWWLRAVGRYRYAPLVPFTRPDRASLIFRASRTDSDDYLVEVSGGSFEPLPPFRSGDRFGWGRSVDHADRLRLAQAILEEATGSHDIAFDQGETLANTFLVEAPDSGWELTAVQLREYVILDA